MAKFNGTYVIKYKGEPRIVLNDVELGAVMLTLTALGLSDQVEDEIIKLIEDREVNIDSPEKLMVFIIGTASLASDKGATISLKQS